ncbi:MAG: ATP-binding cassette domain-containing protein [Elusimicrobia bacterium]|nr:ATP-binding cassette domain-containing protein [Elusimicrobiota bacterium]
MIRIQSLSYQYPHASSNKKMALENVSFNVEKNTIFGLLGPNGGGKTTLFKILTTFFLPTSGSVEIFGLDIFKKMSEVRKKIGVIFQNPSLDKKLSVKENLTHQGHLYGLSGLELKERILLLLLQGGLLERANERIETLSGGMQRRVDILKGMIHNPSLLLMDEPTFGLDPAARIALWEILKKLKQNGTTIVCTTHLMEEAEKCDCLAILNEGKLVALNSPSNLKKEIGGDVIAIETNNATSLKEELKKKFNLQTMLLDEQTLHIEKEKGVELITELIQTFGEKIISISLSKPSLEDVFIHKTGHKFHTNSR